MMDGSLQLLKWNLGVLVDEQAHLVNQSFKSRVRTPLEDSYVSCDFGLNIVLESPADDRWLLSGAFMNARFSAGTPSTSTGRRDNPKWIQRPQDK